MTQFSKDWVLPPSVKCTSGMSRRTFVTGLAAAGVIGLPEVSAMVAKQPMLRGRRVDLGIGYQKVNLTGVERTATVVNGTLPGPILRWREGEDVWLRVNNNLAVDSSIHWHGIILPPEMDGVPGISFAGIRPGEFYDYRFSVQQSGTYWYHSHSDFQEQTGVYGAIIIDPHDPYPYAYDREYVLMLSDWSDEKPESIFAKLKKNSHFYNANPRTFRDLRQQIDSQGVKGTWNDRRMWNQMRMSDRDISDVTGSTYTFLLNGNAPDQNWTAAFRKGEKVLLRVINAAAMTLFDFRIPGLKMTVVAADGQYVEPVTIDEFRIGVAETYDVVVEPQDGAYTLFAQAIDRSGYARGTLTESPGLTAPVPDVDPAPILRHQDMGMGVHSGHATEHMHRAGNHVGHQNHIDSAASSKIAAAGLGSQAAIVHQPSEYGFHVDMRAEQPRKQLNDPGIGLGSAGRRVLTYADLCNLRQSSEIQDPDREIQLHLTGNMERYMWSMDGIRFADATPLQLKQNERLRIVLVNDTMMNHPIHLHGMWSELETGVPNRIPLKHTIVVQPGARISYLVTPEVIGDWAYHCHLLYHMMGMFRRVVVS